MTYRPKHIAEYVLLRLVAAPIAVLPYRGALVLAWGLAWVAFHVVRFRRREAERRIREVFGNDYTPAQVRRIAWRSLRNLMFVAVDTIRSPSLTRERFEVLGDYGPLLDTLRRHLATGRGAIIAVPHLGSWEFGGMGVALAGLPFFVIAGKQRNPLFDRYLIATRERMGMQIIMRGTSTLRTIISRLKQGQLTAILPDVRMPTEGVKVMFLGKPANVGAGMALFARHAGVPIFPAVNLRRGWSRHAGVLFAPIEPDPAADRDRDVQRMTQAVLDQFSEAIRRDPGQWFWYNKRWILDPIE